jgi:hypothetical protein
MGRVAKRVVHRQVVRAFRVWLTATLAARAAAELAALEAEGHAEVAAVQEQLAAASDAARQERRLASARRFLAVLTFSLMRRLNHAFVTWRVGTVRVKAASARERAMSMVRHADERVEAIEATARQTQHATGALRVHAIISRWASNMLHHAFRSIQIHAVLEAAAEGARADMAEIRFHGNRQRRASSAGLLGRFATRLSKRQAVRAARCNASS